MAFLDKVIGYGDVSEEWTKTMYLNSFLMMKK